jgi:hypothetical protein
VLSSCGSEQKEARFGGECPNYAACTHKGCYVAVRSAGSHHSQVCLQLAVQKSLRYHLFCSFFTTLTTRDLTDVGEGETDARETKCAKK